MGLPRMSVVLDLSPHVITGNASLKARFVHSVTVAFFVKNTGDAYPDFSEGFSIAGFDPGRLRWNVGVPRTYGVELSQKFYTVRVGWPSPSVT